MHIGGIMSEIYVSRIIEWVLKNSQQKVFAPANYIIKIFNTVQSLGLKKNGEVD